MARKKIVEEVVPAVEKAAEKIEETTKKVAEKAAAKAKPVAKKAAAKAKPVAEKAEKAVSKTKKAVEKAVAGDTFVLQYAGKEIDVNEIGAKAKEDYKSKGHKTPKNLVVYIKPEEGVAYYTVNGKGSEDFKIEL